MRRAIGMQRRLINLPMHQMSRKYGSQILLKNINYQRLFNLPNFQSHYHCLSIHLRYIIFDHHSLSQNPMNLIHCLFQSFQGAGSIYISEAPTLEHQHLSKHTCRALVMFSDRKKLKCELPNIHELSLKVPSADKLSPLFVQVSQFILASRKDTNIMLWSPQNRELASVFLFAHLILRYGYSLQYIWRIYDQRILHVNLRPDYIAQLKDLAANKDDKQEENQKLGQSSIGQRILRLRRNYDDLGKDSQAVRENKDKGIMRQINPQYKEKREHSETSRFQSYDSEFSATKRRGSIGSQRKTHRKLASTFDFPY